MEFARVLDALVEVCKSFVHAFEPYRENRKPHLHGLFTNMPTEHVPLH